MKSQPIPLVLVCHHSGLGMDMFGEARQRALPPPSRHHPYLLTTTTRKVMNNNQRSMCTGMTSVALQNAELQLNSHPRICCCYFGPKKGEEEMIAKERRSSNWENHFPPSVRSRWTTESQGVLFVTPDRNCKKIRTLIRRVSALDGDLKLWLFG